MSRAISAGGVGACFRVRTPACVAADCSSIRALSQSRTVSVTCAVAPWASAGGPRPVSPALVSPVFASPVSSGARARDGARMDVSSSRGAQIRQPSSSSIWYGATSSTRPSWYSVSGIRRSAAGWLHQCLLILPAIQPPPSGKKLSTASPTPKRSAGRGGCCGSLRMNTSVSCHT